MFQALLLRRVYKAGYFARNRGFSTFPSYTNLSWTTTPRQYDEESGGVNNSRKSEQEAKAAKLKDLELAVKEVARKRLAKMYPALFRGTSMKDMKRTKAGSPIQKLAELNGYQVVLDTPTKNQNERVQLAEGIVARPEYYYTRRRQCEYTLYSLELDSENTSDRLPPLVEPDITIYRLLEGRVEDWLNARRDAWASLAWRCSGTE